MRKPVSDAAGQTRVEILLLHNFEAIHDRVRGDRQRDQNTLPC